MQRCIAFIDLNEAFSEKEFVAPSEASRRQRGCLSENGQGGTVVKVGDRSQQLLDVRRATHGDHSFRNNGALRPFADDALD
jgi:hypothetical protein